MAWLSQKTKRRLEKKAGHLVVQCSLFAMLLGFAYVILYPFLFKILASFMSLDDMYDPTVMLIPKNWTLDIYRGLLQTPDYVEGFYHTTLYAVVVAVLGTLLVFFLVYGVVYLLTARTYYKIVER